jgi:hypothetical protein
MRFLARNDRLLVPVGSLHQPDGDRRTPLNRQLPQPFDVVRGISQVCLDHDPHVRRAAEFWPHHRAGEDLVNQVLVAVLLHVDVHEGAVLARQPEDRKQTRFYVGDDGPGSCRFKPGGEGRKLDRDVDLPGVRASVPPRPRLCSNAQDIQVAFQVRIRFRVRERCLAEEVHRESGAIPDKRLQVRKRLFGGGTGDEAPRHRVDALADEPGHDRPKEPGPAGLRSQPDRARDVFLEILPQMVGD